MKAATSWVRGLLHVASAFVLGCALSPALADDVATVDGVGRVDGRYCALAVRIVFDDGRRFEADSALAQKATVQIRAATLAPSQCGQAPRLAGGITVVPARPAIELTLAAGDWPRHAPEVDALVRRFPQARLHLRVLGSDAAANAAVLQIADGLLQRPETMARTSITPLDAVNARGAVRGWRVAFDAFDSARSVHADSAADVARLLAAAR